MTRSIEKRNMDKIVARLIAEDRALVYLDKLPAETAAVVAYRVAWFLATSWEYKQREMLQRGTAVNAIHISGADIQKLQAMLAMIQLGTPSDAAAEQRVTALLAHEAWWIANKVASWATFRMSCERPMRPPLTSMPKLLVPRCLS
jgi:hypothetical protein